MSADPQGITEVLEQLARDPEAVEDFRRFVRGEHQAGELTTAELEALSGGLSPGGAVGGPVPGIGSLESQIKALMAAGSLSEADMLKLQHLMQKWTVMTQLQSNVVKAIGSTFGR